MIPIKMVRGQNTSGLIEKNPFTMGLLQLRASRCAGECLVPIQEMTRQAALGRVAINKQKWKLLLWNAWQCTLQYQKVLCAVPSKALPLLRPGQEGESHRPKRDRDDEHLGETSGQREFMADSTEMGKFFKCHNVPLEQQ